MIKKIPHLLPLHAKLILYIPLFDYGDTLWGDKNNDTFMGQLQVLQTRQPRFCFKINHQEGHRPRQCSYSFELFKFHDFFQEIFKLSKTLGIAISFKQFTNFSCFRVFLTLNNSTDTNSGVNNNAYRFRCLITPLCLALSSPWHLQELIYQTKL